MNDDTKIAVTDEVRHFYDQVGWHLSEEGYYQNARYEDLRPVSQEYIHNCHLRVAKHLNPRGRYLLDAGSGPIQYPEYLEYSKGYERRVCLDISIVALREARQRIGEHGLFVCADVSRLPFKKDAFDGVVTLHTFHHLPIEDHPRAFSEIYRVLAPQSTAVVVNGWDQPFLTRLFEAPMQIRRSIKSFIRHLRGKVGDEQPKATFVRKNTPSQLKEELRDKIPFQIFCWRSVSVRFLRTYIHAGLGGKALLRILYALEESFPRFFGENGQYPLIVLYKKD